MKKGLNTYFLLLAVTLGSFSFSARAGTYANDFNVDPSTDPNFSFRGNAVWRPTGSYNGSGYISLTDAIASQQGTIVLPDFDGGAGVVAFKVKMKVRIGGGTARPGDGFSVSFADSVDGVVGGGMAGEDGTSTGLSVNLDTYDNGNGDGPAIDIKRDGVIVAHRRFAGSGPQTSSPGLYCAPVEKDGAGNPISLETDPAGTPAPGTWVDLEINLSSCGSLTLQYKGIEVFKDVVTGYGVGGARTGRFVIGARTGGATDNHWIDDLQITTETGDLPPRLASASPVGFAGTSPGRDVPETSVVKFVIDYSGSFYEPNPNTIHLTLDGTDITSDAATTISDDLGARTTTIIYTPPAPYAPSSRHEAVLTFVDTAVPATACTARNVFYVTPVPAGTPAGTTLFVEAEDFNYMDTADNSGGHYFDFGSPNGSYEGHPSKHDVDYHLAASNPESPLYRVLNPPNGISVPGTPDVLRAGVTITPDYKVGWNDSGDWYNFTRTFPNTTYKIYGRFASGGADTHATLAKVTSDPTVGPQTAVALGSFDAETSGGWDTFCFVPLRDASGQDVIVRLNGSTTVRVTSLPGNYDFNYLAFVPTPAPTLRPTVVSATPEPGSESLRDPKIKAVIADADTQVVANSIRLFLDGIELTPITRTDTAAGAEGEYQIPASTSLAVGSSHTVSVVFADNDANPVTQSNNWNFTVGTFKSGTGTLFIEAEDFNYSDDGTTGGLHSNFGDPDCSLLGKDAILDVDYHEGNDGNDQAVFRGPTGVEAGKPGTDGFVRGDHTITCNYVVGWNDAGDWYNYTRDFGASARYNVYARLSSGGADEHAELGVVNGNPAATGQTTSRIGTFDARATGNWDIFHNVPLRDGAGNLVSVRLGGLTTLRFTALPGNFDYNYLAFVRADVQTVTPSVASVEPRAGSDYARAPKVIAVIKDEDSAVVASSLKLSFDGTDVTPLSTITDTASGAMIVYQAPPGSPLGTTHTVKVDWSDNQATPVAGSFTWTYKEGIYNPDSNLFIEAEDFNSDFGAYYPSRPGVPFNEKGMYNGLGAVPGIDYNDSGDGQEANNYRTEGVGNVPHVNMVPIVDSNGIGVGARPGFTVVSDYKIGWTAPGDWYNYTRSYGSSGAYNVYLRASHGDAAATIGGRLELVDGPTSPTQTLSPLGNFRAPATGGWDTFTLIPLKAPDGNLSAVTLSGEATLRYTVEANGGDINFLMLCPILAPNQCPTANSSTVNVAQDSSVAFQLSASDPEGNPLLYVVTQQPAHGTLVVQPATGAATYAPASGYCGADSFRFRVSDVQCGSSEATVSINVSDTTPPSISCPADIFTPASGPNGAVATFSPTASDSCGVASVNCTPPSGSTFPIGTTAVECRAVNSAGLAATCRFNVTVRSPNTAPSCLAEIVPEACRLSFAGSQNAYVLALNGSDACVMLDGSRSTDADNDPLTFTWIVGAQTVSMDAAQEPSGGGTGSGSGTVAISGQTLTINIEFSGLSANVTAAHIHGPAGPGTNASVLYPLNPLTTLGATAGTISGTVTLTEGTGGFTIAQQLEQLSAGLWYVNIHTTLHPGGEIRGQINPGTVSGPLVTTCLPLGCQTVTLFVSDGRAASLCSLTVCVITPCEAVEQCIRLVDGANLQRQNKRPLIATLKAACASLDRGNFEAAAQQLRAFQNKVRAQMARINPADANAFLDCVQKILDGIVCTAGIPGNSPEP